MTRIPVRLALGAAALVLATLAGEHGLRYFDVYGVNHYPDVGRYLSLATIEKAPAPEVLDTWRIFQNRPGVRLELKTFEYRTDARGLRTGASRSAPPADAQRVLFLGDSVTLAWGVDDAESWIRILEREGRAPDGRRLDCLNAGHLMYDTTQQASLLAAWGPALEPEVVVVTWIFNDLHPTNVQITDLLRGISANGEETGKKSFIERRFWATCALLRFRRERKRLAGEERWQYPPYSYYPSGWPRCATALDAIKRTCAALGARLVVNDHSFPEVPELARWCESNAVARIATALSEDDRRRYRNSVIDSHLNAAGNRRLADRALAGLRELGLLAPAD